MKEIDGYKINIQPGPNFFWQIQIQTPQISGEKPNNFIGQFQVNGQLTEELAYNYFKDRNNWKKFCLDVDSEIVKD